MSDENKDLNPDENQQHVIELDDFELNSQLNLDEDTIAEEGKDDGDEKPSSDDKPDTDGGEDDLANKKSADGEETPNGQDAGDGDDASPDDDGEKLVPQDTVDKIVHARLKQREAKHQLELEREREKAAAVQKQLDAINAHNESEAQRQKELEEAIAKDDLVDDEVKGLSKPKEFTAPVHATGVQRFPVSDPSELQLNATELDIKMRAQWGEHYQLNAMKIANGIQNGVFHHDILTLANQNRNGTLLLDKVLKDDAIYNELALAGYQSKDFDQYSLKFKELASNLAGGGDDKLVEKVKKAKPEPNKPLKPAPASSTIDDDVVYIP